MHLGEELADQACEAWDKAKISMYRAAWDQGKISTYWAVWMWWSIVIPMREQTG